MKANTIAKTAAMMTLLLMLGAMSIGCSWSIGGGTRGETQVRPTRGQELLDLKRALDSGAINQQEYDLQKKKIVDR